MEKLVNDFIADCDIEKLREEATTNIQIAMMNDWEEDGYYSAYLGDIVSSAYGQYQYQAKEVCEYFGIEYVESVYLWYQIDNVADRIAEELTVLSKLNGNFYFGHLETDSSYGLFYIEKKEGEQQ